MGSTSYSDQQFTKNFEEGQSNEKKSKNVRNFLILVGVGALTAGILLAIVIPVCIENDCSGMLVEPTTTTTKSAPTTTTPAETTTTRTTFTTTTHAPVTTTTVTTTPAPPPTTTTRGPITLPTIFPPPTTTEPPALVPRSLSVATAYGPVVGNEITITPDPRLNSQYHRIASWRGIPFAQPPIGPLRWQKPMPPNNWTEPRASQEIPMCVQSGGTVRATHPHWQDFQEDCLYVHVTAPMDTLNEPYPVMVWIFGGSFQSGGNVQYPGHFLSSKGVVVVTVNYRLNIFGFASTADGTTPGNFGLWDQREAILWTENNIRAFGGDPTKITVFGESAGAASTGLVVASPQVKGHIHGAILESGSDYAIWGYNGDDVHPETYIYDVAPQFGCGGGTDTEMMDCLRDVTDVQQLRRARFDCPFCLGFAPIVDGPGGFLPKTPVELRNDRSSSEIPIMVGVNSNECSIGLIAEDATLLLRGMNRTEYEWAWREVWEYFGFAITEPNREQVKEELYEAMSWFYAPWPTIDDGQMNKLELSLACLDIAFESTANDLVRHHSRYSTTYKYMFGFDPQPTFPPARLIPEWVGVPHAVELAYVWGYVFLGENPNIARDTGNLTLDLGVPITFSGADKDYSDFTMTLWTNFAKYGNPTPSPISPPGGDGPKTWDPFTEDDWNYFHMDNEGTETRKNFRAKQASFVNNYMTGVGRGGDFHNPKRMPDWPLPTAASVFADTISVAEKPVRKPQRPTRSEVMEKLMKNEKVRGLFHSVKQEFDFDALRIGIRSYIEENHPELLQMI